MTPEELEAAIRNNSAEKLTALLLPLTEPERKKLARAAVRIKRVAKEELSAVYQSLRVYSSANQDLCKASGFQARVELAIVAFCPWTEARKVTSRISGWGISTDYVPLIYQILKARKPDWLERWAAKELEGRTEPGDWGLIRQLIRDGLCPKPTSQEYIIKMVHGLPGYRWREHVSLADHLRADPGLLEDEVWRIFEVDPLNETLLPDMGAGQDLWSKALAELVKEGRLDRCRMLKASLEALTRGLQPKNTGWFWKFHECLQPTVEERIALQPLYLKLLASSVTPVAGFALDALSEIANAKRLDNPGFVEAIEPIFHLRPKAQPMAAIRLLKQAAQREPALKVRAAVVAAAGLRHEKSEVQQAALAVIETFVAEPSAELAGVLESHLDALAPSLQDRARKLLNQLHGDLGDLSKTEAAAPCSTAAGMALDELRIAADEVPAPWRKFAGIDDLLAILDGNAVCAIPAASFDPMSIPRCDPERRLTPIRDLDELIEGLAAALEGLRDGDEFERLLDGLSRLCDQHPEDFQARTAPLGYRAQKLSTPGWGGFTVTLRNFGLRGGLIKLLRCWSDPGQPPFETEPEKGGGILWFLAHRLRELSERMIVRRAAPLLGCPTHRHGWIEPVELVQRLRWWQEHDMQPDRHDFIQALLRLAPEGRDLARRAAAGLQGECGCALQHALGSEVDCAAMSMPLLLAAGRARQPRGELTELLEREGSSGPDGAVPASYAWKVRMGKDYRSQPIKQLVVKALPQDNQDEALAGAPTLLLHQLTWREFVDPTPEHRWAASVWPHNLDPILAVGASAVVARLHHPASPYSGNTAFVERLLDPDTPFTEMAQLLLSVALVSRDADVFGLAVDALIQAIADGRCAGKELGGILGRLMVEELIKANRLAKSLDTVARASPLHMHVCGQVLQAALAALLTLPRDVHHLLGVLHEWLVALDQPIAEEACTVLAKVPGSGKTKALARKLAERRGQASRTTWGTIVREALRGRIDRARRWMELTADKV